MSAEGHGHGASLIEALKRKFKTSDDADARPISDKTLADRLGISLMGLHRYKARDILTPLQIATLVNAAHRAGEAAIQKTAIRPLVEFYPASKCESRNGAKFELFEADKTHPYLRGLRDELSRHHGVYVFFDSRGHAIYAGKARKQFLWKEMTLAFNRNRGDVQSIKRVHHPSRRQEYKTSEEKSRQIRRRLLSLHEMASYFSAYAVVDGMIDEVEAMLVRSFANDLLNIRMEQFGSQRRRAGA